MIDDTVSPATQAVLAMATSLKTALQLSGGGDLAANIFWRSFQDLLPIQMPAGPDLTYLQSSLECMDEAERLVQVQMRGQ